MLWLPLCHARANVSSMKRNEEGKIYTPAKEKGGALPEKGKAPLRFCLSVAAAVSARGVAGGELEARGGAVKLGSDFGELFGRAAESPEASLGLFALEARAGGVHLLGELGEVGEDGDAVVVDLDEAARDEEASRRRPLRVGEHAGLERRDERRVAGQNPQLAAEAGHGHRVRLLREQPALRRDDV